MLVKIFATSLGLFLGGQVLASELGTSAPGNETHRIQGQYDQMSHDPANMMPPEGAPPMDTKHPAQHPPMEGPGGQNHHSPTANGPAHPPGHPPADATASMCEEKLQKFEKKANKCRNKKKEAKKQKCFMKLADKVAKKHPECEEAVRAKMSQAH